MGVVQTTLAKEERRYLRSAAPSPIVPQLGDDGLPKSRRAQTIRKSGLLSSDSVAPEKVYADTVETSPSDLDSDQVEKLLKEVDEQSVQEDQSEDEAEEENEQSDDESVQKVQMEEAENAIMDQQSSQESEESEEQEVEAMGQKMEETSSSESESDDATDQKVPKAPLPGGFRILTITMPPLNTRKDGKIVKIPVSHQMFYKRHESRQLDDLPNGKTLFLVNIPVDTSLSHLENLFQDCGVIDRVEWGRDFHARKVKPIVPIQKSIVPIQPLGAQRTAEAYDLALDSFMDTHANAVGILKPWTMIDPLHATASTCYIVFSKSSSVRLAEALPPKPRVWSMEKSLLGISRWEMEQKIARPNTKVLGPLLDALLVSMSTKEQDLRLSALSQIGQPDEEGFVTVTRAKGRRGNVVHNPDGSSVGAISWEDMTSDTKKKKPKKQLVNFYRFQQKDKKMNGW